MLLVFKRNRRGSTFAACAYVLPSKLSPTGSFAVLCCALPPKAAEAFRIAEANVKILRARAYNSKAKADKHALDEA